MEADIRLPIFPFRSTEIDPSLSATVKRCHAREPRPQLLTRLRVDGLADAERLRRRIAGRQRRREALV